VVQEQTVQEQAGFEVLSSVECLTLLSAQQVGRLGVLVRGYPLVIPVNYGLDGTVVVVRMHPGSTLSAADHAHVCFEVDQLDPSERTGWSVLVRGLAEDVSDLEHDLVLERSQLRAVQPWAPGEHARLLRIITHDISGRRIQPGQPAFELGGYL
jgi:nitroimidazol reductase NimA-like FMN-containing flavoprotein (pyridoxamine 5'-phosphate oxidase superfamily)